MKPGLRTYQPTGKIDYKQLRKINPEAARRAVLGYLKTNNHNISEAASIFGINRPVVYDIIKKEKEGNLRDRPKVPKHQPRRTPMAIEDKVIEVKNRTRLGPERLSRHLKQHEGISIPAGTVRHIIRRNKKKINYHLRSHRVRKEKREFIDWYSAKPFEIVQIDLKYIRDHKALSKEQIIHLDRYDIPNYQWSALDVSSRWRLKIRSSRLRTEPGLGRKDYHATLNSMKAYRFPREQFAILSGETRRRLITICAPIGSGKRRESLPAGIQPNLSK